MSNGSATTSPDSVSQEARAGRAVNLAKYLVAFILLINVCFAIYMVGQFFVPKTYGNGLHAIYTTIVFATTVLLGLSAHRLWNGDTKQGTSWFFAAIAISFVGNLVSALFA